MMVFMKLTQGLESWRSKKLPKFQFHKIYKILRGSDVSYRKECITLAVVSNKILLAKDSTNKVIRTSAQ